METIEHKIGDTFCLEDGTKLEVVKATCNCRGCYFFNDKDNRCSRTKDIVCSAPRRTDKEFVIFKQIKDNNNMKKKKTIDIYVVMQVHKTHRSFCGVFTSFKEANSRFEMLLKNFKKIYKVQPRDWTIECLPSQIKVFIIGDITLYLCKETKEVKIEENIPEPVFENSTVEESNVGPFFSANNCFNETIKHTPFGILKDGLNNYYTILGITDCGISILDGNHKVSTITFEFANTFLKYTDNTHFGYII